MLPRAEQPDDAAATVGDDVRETCARLPVQSDKRLARHADLHRRLDGTVRRLVEHGERREDLHRRIGGRQAGEGIGVAIGGVRHVAQRRQRRIDLADGGRDRRPGVLRLGRQQSGLVTLVGVTRLGDHADGQDDGGHQDGQGHPSCPA